MRFNVIDGLVDRPGQGMNNYSKRTVQNKYLLITSVTQDMASVAAVLSGTVSEVKGCCSWEVASKYDGGLFELI